MWNEENAFNFFMDGEQFIYDYGIILIAIVVIIILSIVLIIDKFDAYFKKRDKKDKNTSESVSEPK